MKSVVLLPPVVALVAVSGWIGAERQSISTLETEAATLRRAISAREAEISAEGAGDLPGQAEKDRKAAGPIDWKEIAAAMAAEPGNDRMGELRNMRLQRRLLDMTGPQLAAALDEIASLDVPADVRSGLEAMLLGPLINKDPEMALNRYIDRVSEPNSPVLWQLPGAIRNWAAKDPAAAIAWMDRAIAAGKFESKSLDGARRSRVQFETQLVTELLATDAGAAGKRLAAMTEDERNEILSRAFKPGAPDTHAAYAALVREQASAGREAGIIGDRGGELADSKGFAQVDKYLDAISANAEERAATGTRAGVNQIREVAAEREITAADLDAMRAWVGKNAPDALAETTGSALGRSMDRGRNNTFAHAAELALQYHAASGDDKVLTSFLQNGDPGRNKDEARAVAGQINDPDLRAKFLDDLK